MPDDWNSDATPDQIAASGLTVDTDDDNDGVLDVFDHFPLDAALQYVPLADAVAGIVDPVLRACFEEFTAGMNSVAEVQYQSSGYTPLCSNSQGVTSLEGLEKFTHLASLNTINGSITCCSRSLA